MSESSKNATDITTEPPLYSVVMGSFGSNAAPQYFVRMNDGWALIDDDEAPGYRFEWAKINAVVILNRGWMQA